MPDERILQISRRASPRAPGGEGPGHRTLLQHLTRSWASYRAGSGSVVMALKSVSSLLSARHQHPRPELQPPPPQLLRCRPRVRGCLPIRPARSRPRIAALFPHRAARAGARRRVRAAPPLLPPPGARPAPLSRRPARSRVSGTPRVGFAWRNFPLSSAPQRCP